VFLQLTTTRTRSRLRFDRGDGEILQEGSVCGEYTVKHSRKDLSREKRRSGGTYLDRTSQTRSRKDSIEAEYLKTKLRKGIKRPINQMSWGGRGKGTIGISQCGGGGVSIGGEGERKSFCCGKDRRPFEESPTTQLRPCRKKRASSQQNGATHGHDDSQKEEQICAKAKPNAAYEKPRQSSLSRRAA